MELKETQLYKSFEDAFQRNLFENKDGLHHTFLSGKGRLKSFVVLVVDPVKCVLKAAGNLLTSITRLFVATIQFLRDILMGDSMPYKRREFKEIVGNTVDQAFTLLFSPLVVVILAIRGSFGTVIHPSFTVQKNYVA